MIVVMTNGCFDLLHAGHVDMLQRARALGDMLIVAVNSDESVARLKGSRRPILPLADRMAVLRGLKCVTDVVPFAEDTPLQVILKIRPDVLVKGSDYKVKDIVGAKEVQGWGGRVVAMPIRLRHMSTTEIIRRIKETP